MRAVLVTALLVLAVAAPAGAITIDKTVSSSLYRASPAAVAAVTKSGKLHSCQAGDRRAHVGGTTAAGETERKAAAVACEQPPRSNLLTPDSIAKATAAALSVLG